MHPKINKIFVYGTLMQGEERGRDLCDCDLIKTADLPGTLYDTRRGYPAARFDEDSNSGISGEIYLMKNPSQKLIELDEVEGVPEGLYKRALVNYDGENIYSYEPGPQLLSQLSEADKLDSGNWSIYSSLAQIEPLLFAVNFEKLQRIYYSKEVSEESNGIIHLKGVLPILVTAPHSSVHTRMGKLKRQEFYTGAIASSLHSITGSHALFTNRLMDRDPNFYDDSPFKERLADIVSKFGIRFVIDLHGTGAERSADIYPGVGKDKEFLLRNAHYLDILNRHVSENELTLGGLGVFPAVKQMTVTKFAAQTLGASAIQLEINKRLREPEDQPGEYLKMLACLIGFIESLCQSD